MNDGGMFNMNKLLSIIDNIVVDQGHEGQVTFKIINQTIMLETGFVHPTPIEQMRRALNYSGMITPAPSQKDIWIVDKEAIELFRHNLRGGE